MRWKLSLNVSAMAFVVALLVGAANPAKNQAQTIVADKPSQNSGIKAVENAPDSSAGIIANQSSADSAADSVTQPDLKIPASANAVQLEKLIGIAKGMRPRSPEEYLAMQTAIRDASERLLQLIDEKSPRGQQAKLDSLTSSVSLIAAEGPQAREKTLKNVRDYLTNQNDLTLADVQTGILTATFLEMQPNKAPARAMFELLVDLLKEDAREEMQSLRQNLLANVRRLNLLGNKFDFEATALDGSKIRIADLAGKFVVVDFFATWCEPCIAEMPQLRGYFDKYSSKGLAIVGISLDEKAETLREYIDKAKLPWPTIHDAAEDPAASLRMRFGVANLPTMLLLNKEGVVVSLEARGPELDRLMQRLFEQPTLAEPPPAVGATANPAVESAASKGAASKSAAAQTNNKPIETKNAAKKGSVSK